MRILLRSFHNQIGWLRLERFVRFDNFSRLFGVPRQHQCQIGQQAHLRQILQRVVRVLPEWNVKSMPRKKTQLADITGTST